MKTRQTQLDFEQTEEAQEYINKLQMGKAELPGKAVPLEHKSLQNLRDLNQRLRQITTSISDIEKDIQRFNERKDVLVRESNLASGEMTGYAKLLASAEGERRQPKPGESDNEGDTESKADASSDKGGNGAAKPKTKSKAKDKSNQPKLVPPAQA